MTEKPVTAEEFLEKIQDDENIIQRKVYERKYWEELTQSITTNVEGVRVKGGGDGTALQKQIAEIVLIDQEIQRLKHDIAYRISVMGELYADEYVFLHKVYVQHISYSNICNTERKSYSWAMKLRKRALDHLQRIINEKIYT